MPHEFDAPDPQAPVEPQPVAVDPAPPVAEPEAAQEEYVPYRVGEQEVPLPLSAVQAIADSLTAAGLNGYDNPASILNQLRNGGEAQELIKQARSIYQQARQRPQYEPPPVDERWNQHLQQQGQYRQPPPQRQPVDDEDPVGLLRQIREDQAAFRQYIQYQEAEKAQNAQRQLQQLDRQANVEYEKFKSELVAKKVPDWKIPDRDYLLREAEMVGMFHGETQIGDMYRNVWKMLNADYLAENAASNAVQSHVERMRDPRSRVTVPVSRPAPPPAQKPGSEIDGLKIGDVFGAEFKI